MPVMTIREAVSQALWEEMERDPNVIIMGEEVGVWGGTYAVTKGFYDHFGAERVRDTPIAEGVIVGAAVGAAMNGLRPVAEIMTINFAFLALDQIVNHAAKVRSMFGGQFKCPLVIRVTYGGYLQGGAVYHSQCGEVLFTHTPGMRVVMPSTALDANGLLRTAIRCDDPVMFLEHKHLYRQTYNRAAYPGPDFMIPFGKASVVRAGDQVSVITYGAVVQRAMQAAGVLAREGIELEIVDLRSLSPYDWEAVAATVRKTNRVIIAYEDMMTGGYGAEIAARIAEELFEELDAPLKRVAAEDVFCAYQPALEEVILPQAEDIVRTARELAKF